MIKINSVHAIELLTFIRMSGTVIGPETQLGEAIRVIDEQLATPTHAKDLVDIVADILASPKAKVILTGDFLVALRLAILSPRELAKVNALAAEWAGCTKCARKISDGGITSLYGQSPYCIHCHFPQSFNCPNCNSHQTLPDAIYRIIRKLIKECKVCANKATDPTIAPEFIPADDTMLIQDREIERQLGRGVRRVQPPPPPHLTWTTATTLVQPPIPDAPQAPQDFMANPGIVQTVQPPTANQWAAQRMTRMLDEDETF